MSLEIVTPGIILKTGRFDACAAFYRDVVGLPVWFEKPGLCCLRFADAYLMVERGGVAEDAPKPPSRNPTVLRFNVADVEAGAAALRAKGVTVEVHRFDWGTIGTFTDPDGNACELKNADDAFFQGAR